MPAITTSYHSPYVDRESNECRDRIGQEPDAFDKLYRIIKNMGKVRPSKFASAKEKLANFLYMLAPNMKTTGLGFFFRHDTS